MPHNQRRRLTVTALAVFAVVLAMWASAIVSHQIARAAETPIPPAPTMWVTDTAGVLSSSTVDSLNAQLKQYEQSTGHQLIVWVGQTTGDTPLEDWTIKAFTKWKVGRKNLDDGLALFIFMQDHKIRIEVGYGLEGQVTDATASRIARTIIAPQMKAGNVDAAVTDGVNALIAAIGGQTEPTPTPSSQSQPAPLSVLFDLIFPLFFVILFFYIIIRSASYASRRGYTIGSGGSGSGWWGGYSGGGDDGGGWSGGDSGGGFSGGGGSGGGGGASASW